MSYQILMETGAGCPGLNVVIATQISRAGNTGKSNREASPVMGSGVWTVCDAGACAKSHPVKPRWRFAYFADTGKVGRAAARNNPFINTPSNPNLFHHKKTPPYVKSHTEEFRVQL